MSKVVELRPVNSCLLEAFKGERIESAYVIVKLATGEVRCVTFGNAEPLPLFEHIESKLA